MTATVRKFGYDQPAIDKTSWQGVQAAADQAQNLWTQFFMAYYQNVAGGVDLAGLEQALSMGAHDHIPDRIPFDEFKVGRELAKEVKNLAGEGGGITGIKVNLRFDLDNPKTVDFLDRYSFGLIKGLNDTSREGIRAILRDAQIQGMHPRQQAQMIKTMIGLDPRRAGALVKWTANLRAKNPKASEEWISARVQRQSDKLLLERAKTIAQTETIRVSAMGQQEAWRQAAEAGLIDAENVRRVWITTKDDKLCDYCKALDGAAVALDGEWTASLKLVGGAERSVTALTPPLHTLCRCAMGLEMGQAPMKVRVEAEQQVKEPAPDKKPPKPKKEPKEPAGDAWADKVKGRITEGVATEHDAVEVGKLVAEEIDKQVKARLAEQTKTISPLKREVAELVKAKQEAWLRSERTWQEFKTGKIPKEVSDEAQAAYLELSQTWAAKLKALNKAEDKGAPDRAEIIREVLGRIRPMGIPKGGDPSLITVADTEEAKGAQTAIKKALKNLPSAWVKLSKDTGPMLVDGSKRGYYRSGRPATVVISGMGPEGKERVALHELMHRTEDIFGPRVRGLEWRFYERRTKGENLAKMGKGYEPTELTRTDHFAHKYMGKDYRPGGKVPDDEGYRSSWEILSMGVEHEFYDPDLMAKDPEMRHLILGILAGV